MLFSSDWTVKHILKCALYSNLTLCVLNYHYINSIFFRYIFIVYKNEVNIYIYIFLTLPSVTEGRGSTYCWTAPHDTAWENNPHRRRMLTWGEHHPAVFSLVLHTEEVPGTSAPSLTAWDKDRMWTFFFCNKQHKNMRKKGKINRLSVSRERPATAAKLSSKPSKCNSSAF